VRKARRGKVMQQEERDVMTVKNRTLENHQRIICGYLMRYGLQLTGQIPDTFDVHGAVLNKLPRISRSL
jgi:hypothetical protein